jgi:hypothetical protein
MIGNDIRSVCKHLADYQKDGRLTEAVLEAALGALRASADEIDAIQSQAVPAHLRGGLTEVEKRALAEGRITGGVVLFGRRAP